MVLLEPLTNTPTGLPRLLSAELVPMKLLAIKLPVAPAATETPADVLNPIVLGGSAELAPPIVFPELATELPNAFCKLLPAESVPMKSPATKLPVPVIEIPEVVLYPMTLRADTVVPPIVLPELVIEIPTVLVSLSAAESVPTKLPITRLPVPASAIPDVVLNPMMLASAAANPPIVLFDALTDIPIPFPNLLLVEFVPIKLPMTRFPVALTPPIETAAAELNPMIFAAAVVVPPIVLPAALSEMPTGLDKVAPAELVPTKLPAIKLSAAETAMPEIVLSR